MVFFEYSAHGDGVRHPETGVDQVGTIIGSNALFAGFEQALAGHAAGESFETDLDFPENFQARALAGKSAHVEIRVVQVQAPELPPVDDKFAASFGVREGGLEQFRNDVRANLERELANMLSARLKSATVEKLLVLYPDLDIPQAMIENDARALARQAKNTDAQAHEAYLGAARNRVAAGLLLAELARQNGIQLDSRRVSSMLASIASTYEEPEQVVEMYSRDPQLMSGLQSRVLEDQVIDWIAEHARASEQPLTFGEVMRPGA
jgi:trigger factor